MIASRTRRLHAVRCGVVADANLEFEARLERRLRVVDDGVLRQDTIRHDEEVAERILQRQAEPHDSGMLLERLETKKPRALARGCHRVEIYK